MVLTLGGNFRTLLTGFGQTYRDSLLSTLHASAFSAFARFTANFKVRVSLKCLTDFCPNCLAIIGDEDRFAFV
jgi:hypothetical protein